MGIRASWQSLIWGITVMCSVAYLWAHRSFSPKTDAWNGKLSIWFLFSRYFLFTNICSSYYDRDILKSEGSVHCGKHTVRWYSGTDDFLYGYQRKNYAQEISVSWQKRRAYHHYHRESPVWESGQEPSRNKLLMCCHDLWHQKNIYPLVQLFCTWVASFPPAFIVGITIHIQARVLAFWPLS